MFVNWRYHRRLTKLQAERKKIGEDHEPLLKSARLKSNNEYQKALSDLFRDLDEINDEIAELRHDRTIDLAERFGVLVTSRRVNAEFEDDSAWEESRFSGRWFLSEAEAVRLRSAIRLERKERFEERSRWLPPLLSVLSLIVAILALVLRH